MITDKITFKAQKNAPSPKEVDYWIDTATDPNGGTIKYNDGKEWTQLNQTSSDTEIPKNTVKITYDELFALRNSNSLTPGEYYEITDYWATVKSISGFAHIAANSNNYGIKFHIIVTAVANNQLSHQAFASPKEGGPYTAEVLRKWKIWYDLDNDSEKYPWTPGSGHGVIYRMIDENQNDANFDFKNIYIYVSQSPTKKFIADDVCNNVINVYPHEGLFEITGNNNKINNIHIARGWVGILVIEGNYNAIHNFTAGSSSIKGDYNTVRNIDLQQSSLNIGSNSNNNVIENAKSTGKPITIGEESSYNNIKNCDISWEKGIVLGKQCNRNNIINSQGVSFGDGCYRNYITYSHENTFGTACNRNSLKDSNTNIFENSCYSNNLYSSNNSTIKEGGNYNTLNTSNSSTFDGDYNNTYECNGTSITGSSNYIIKVGGGTIKGNSNNLYTLNTTVTGNNNVINDFGGGGTTIYGDYNVLSSNTSSSRIHGNNNVLNTGCYSTTVFGSYNMFETGCQNNQLGNNVASLNNCRVCNGTTAVTITSDNPTGHFTINSNNTGSKSLKVIGSNIRPCIISYDENKDELIQKYEDIVDNNLPEKHRSFTFTVDVTEDQLNTSKVILLGELGGDKFNDVKAFWVDGIRQNMANQLINGSLSYTFTKAGEHQITVEFMQRTGIQGALSLSELTVPHADFSNTDLSAIRNGYRYVFGTSGTSGIKKCKCEYSKFADVLFGFEKSSLESVSFDHAITENVTDISNMFSDCQNLVEVRMDCDLSNVIYANDMFKNVTTNGVLYYNSRYDFSKILEQLPDTWKAVDINPNNYYTKAEIDTKLDEILELLNS